MERRDVQRLRVEFPVEFVILGQETVRFEGVLRDVSEGGLSLTTNTGLEPGSFVRLEIAGAAFFGEVRYCQAFSSGSLAGLFIERVLLGESELLRLLAFAETQAPELAVLISR